MSVVFPINPDDRYEEYTATAGQTVFAVPFPFQDDRDLTIIKVAAADGAVSTLTLTTHYALSGAGTPGPGSMTLVTGAAVGDKLRIIGSAVLDRLTSIVRDGKYSSRAQDDEHDRHRLIQQELMRDVIRAVKSDYNEPGLSIKPSSFDEGDTLMIGPGNSLTPGPDADNIEAAQGYANDAEAAKDITVAARDEAVAAAASIGNPVNGQEVVKTINYAIVAGDARKTVTANSAGALTFSLPAAATAGAGFQCRVFNKGSGALSVDADGAETINGAAALTLLQYEAATLFTDGLEWRAVKGASTVSGSVPNATTRTAMLALDPAAVSLVFLNEAGREGLFTSQLYSSLSAAEQADATADDAAAQADYVIDSPYVWVRKLGVPNSAGKYGMHPDATASENVTAFHAALAREPYLVIPAGTYDINAKILSPREGQIIEGEGFETVIRATAALDASNPMLTTTSERYQVIRDISFDGNDLAAYGVRMDYPKHSLIGARVQGTNTAGVWMSYFTQFIGEGCYITDNNGVGILVADGTGQVNDMRIGGGRISSCSGNGQHGILVTTPNRDGFWINDWNMENNNLQANGYAHVAFNAAVKGVHIARMYHETDIDDANGLMYRFVSSLQNVSMRNIKMNSGSSTTNPNYHIWICSSGGTIAENYMLDDIWAGGQAAYVIHNDASAGGVNKIIVGPNFFSAKTGGDWRWNDATSIFTIDLTAL
jgi:hypothetical protein